MIHLGAAPAIATLFAAAACCSAAEPPIVAATVGYNKPYLDESGSAAFGAWLELPVTSRFAVRPEYVQSRQRFYGQRFFVASALWYLAPRTARVAPYLIGGGGWIRREERFLSYRSYAAGPLFGVGTQWRFARWTAGPEFRVGQTAIPILTFSIGRQLGRSGTRTL